MISIDNLLLPIFTYIITFISVNKFTILILYYILEKLALKTKTTIDNRILTFIKNFSLTLLGKGNIVNSNYENYIKLKNKYRRKLEKLKGEKKHEKN